MILEAGESSKSNRRRALSPPWRSSKKRRRNATGRTGQEDEDRILSSSRTGILSGSRLISPSGGCSAAPLVAVLLLFACFGHCHSLLGAGIGRPPFLTGARSRHGFSTNNHPTSTSRLAAVPRATSSTAAGGAGAASAGRPSSPAGTGSTRRQQQQPRGRPRKTSTARTSLSATSRATAANRPRQLRKKTTTKKKKKTTRSASTAAAASKRQQGNDAASDKDGFKYTPARVSNFMDRALLEHDLLSMEEEQKYGIAVQRANKIRAALSEILEKGYSGSETGDEEAGNEDETTLREKQQQQQQQFAAASEEKEEENDSLDLLDLLMISRRNGGGGDSGAQHNIEVVDDDNSVDDDLVQLSVYGMDPAADDANDRRNTRDWLIRQESSRRRREQEDPLFASVEDDGSSSSVDEREFAEEYFDDRIRTMVPLDDDEILASLGLEGGRSALRQVLLDGSAARDALIRGNIRLVLSVAKRWAKQSAKADGADSLTSVYAGSWDRPSLDEAVQEGIVGLATAVDRFDPDRKYRFSTYATWWVTNSVRQCFNRALAGCVRLPAPVYDTRRKFRKLVKHYYETAGEVPDLDILAGELGVGLSRLELVLRVTRPLISIDNPLGRGEYSAPGRAGGGASSDALVLGDTLIDSELTPDELVELSLLRQSLESAMATELAPYERDILRLRLGLDDGVTRTVRQVAKEFGGALTMSEVRSGEKRAYNKLRSPRALSTYSLLNYLDLAGVDKSTIAI